MNLELLRTFVAIADGQSFTAAAKIRHMTQSTVSHQIRRLEEDIGQKLLQRTTRHCRLTDDGQVVYQYAKKILTLCDELNTRFKEQPLQGKIKFGAPDDYLSLSFSRIIARFARVQANVEIEIKVGLTDVIRPLVENGDIDLAILTQIPPTGKGIPLYREKLVWLASTDFEMPANGVIPLALAPQPCQYRQAALSALEEAGLKWQIALSCHSHETIKTAVGSGLAITVLSENNLRPGLRVLGEADGLPAIDDSEVAFHKAPNLDNEAALLLAQQIIQN